jgi:hypothetical protein
VADHKCLREQASRKPTFCMRTYSRGRLYSRPPETFVEVADELLVTDNSLCLAVERVQPRPDRVVASRFDDLTGYALSAGRSNSRSGCPGSGRVNAIAAP